MGSREEPSIVFSDLFVVFRLTGRPRAYCNYLEWTAGLQQHNTTCTAANDVDVVDTFSTEQLFDGIFDTVYY